MKKLMKYAFLASFTLFAGCFHVGSSQAERSVYYQTGEFMDALKEGDLAKARTFFAQDVPDTSGLLNVEQQLTTYLEDTALMDHYEEAALEYKEKYLETLIDDYSIRSIEMEGNEAQSRLTVTGIDDSQLRSSETYGKLASKLEKSQKTDKGEYLLELLNKELKKAPLETFNYYIDWQLIDGQWQAISLQITQQK